MKAKTIHELEAELNADSLEIRLSAAGEIGRRIEAGELTRQLSGELNNHVHTRYSFSPYSPSLAAYKAWAAGLRAVGIMDHDSVSGCAEMLDAAERIGIASTVGFELRVNMTGTAMEGRKINNPDSENIAYIAIHGIPRDEISAAAEFLEPVLKARNVRNRQMVDRMNHIARAWGLEPLDYEGDIEATSRASEGGSVTERHLLYALANRVISTIGKGQPLVGFLEEKVNIGLPGKIRDYLLDRENQHYAYDLLGVFKSTVIQEIYIQPNEEECVGVREALIFAKHIGAISAYAYLGDITESPTGDKKAEAFEDSFLEDLFGELKNLGFDAVTYMPPRNTIDQLRRLQSLCKKYGFMEISGVDINSSRQSFNCPELLAEEFRHLGTSAWALIAHEKLSSANAIYGLFSSANPSAEKDLESRVGAYGKIGEAIDPRNTNSALRVWANLVGEEILVTNSILKYAPFVRGLHRIGETGAFVRCATGVEGVELSKKGLLPPLEVAEEPAPGLKFRDAYNQYVSEYGAHPGVVRIGDEGFLFVGRSYDETFEVERYYSETGGTSVTSATERKGARADRGDIVRGRIAVVTGGAQGFGESIVREIIEAGAFVWIADINTDGAEELCLELNKAAGRTVSKPVSVNVTDEESVSGMVDTIVTECGGIDLFISNAGVLKAGSVKEMELGDFQFVTSVNYTGYFLCVKHVSPVLALQNSAAEPYYSDIIQINSKSGLEGSNKNSAYAGGKFGGIGLTESFALELIADNIKVNSVCPGNFFDGPLWSDPDRGLFVQYLQAKKVPGAKTVEDVKSFYEAKVPMGRGCSGVDVVKAIYYIVDQKYETGQAVPVTGGQVMLR